MKTIVLLFSSIILIVLPTNAIQEDIPHDGYWWDNVSNSLKLGYVIGLADGYETCYSLFNDLFWQADSISESDYYNILNEYAQYVTTLLYRTTDITYGEMVEGLDRFYGDQRNRGIMIEGVLKLVRMEVGGKSDAYIDSVARRLRKEYKKLK